MIGYDLMLDQADRVYRQTMGVFAGGFSALGVPAYLFGCFDMAHNIIEEMMDSGISEERAFLSSAKMIKNIIDHCNHDPKLINVVKHAINNSTYYINGKVCNYEINDDLVVCIRCSSIDSKETTLYRVGSGWDNIEYIPEN